ncbi:endonuclease NucS domain-containing protein [Planctomycetota bacterium]
MATQIKTWQIVDGNLVEIETSLAKENRTEPYDLEQWIASNPKVLSPDIRIIGRQTMTKSGPMDFLAIDKSGNLVVIELKRDKLPREALAQAIDYSSDIASWSLDKISEECTKYTSKGLEDFITEDFPDVDIENLNINEDQRILLVGFSIESSLERMIEWLSDGFGVNINAILFNYIKTKNGDELLTKTSIISEEVEQERTKKRKFTIPKSDEPGDYEKDELKRKLKEYLKRSQVTNQRIKDIILPYCLNKGVLTREILKSELTKYDSSVEPAKAGYHLTIISNQLGMKKNDFLRQIIKYEYPTYEWEKDNYQIREGYSELAKEILEELKKEN